MRKRRILRFGIQSLDRLIGAIRSKPTDKPQYENEPQYGIDLGDRPSLADAGPNKDFTPVTSSICLAGPDGTGKSVLSLHLAAHYLADCLSEYVDAGKSIPKGLKVLYISTDLTYNMASKGWKHFALNYPLERNEPLVQLSDGKIQCAKSSRIQINLTPYLPAGDEVSTRSVVKYLEEYEHSNSSPVRAEVCFLDLASRTAGDDWGFVHRLLSNLEEPTATDEPRHLVILDAVEGFETLVGDLNAFGEKSSRRSRIAQIMRLASGRCHLLLVVEEGRRQRFPEEFVTDVVIRLRNTDTGRYKRRTVEIEKARGQAHIRGQHPYVIRDGTGSTTGERDNADDPPVFRNDVKTKPQGYVHVFPSLDCTNRLAMTDRSTPLNTPDKTRFAAFGLPYLDNMLGGKGERAERDETEGFDTRGLPCSVASALIGDSLTQKSQLGRAFLARAFHSLREDLGSQILREINLKLDDSLIAQFEARIREVSEGKISAAEVAKETLRTINDELEAIAHRLDEGYPVAVLFTTEDLNPNALTDDFYQSLNEEPLASTRGGNKPPREAVTSLSAFEPMLTKDIERFAQYYTDQGITPGQPEAAFPEQHQYVLFRKLNKRLFNRNILVPRIEGLIKRHIQQHTICRRFEIHDLTGPVLMNIFQRSIEKAQRIVFFGADDANNLPLFSPATRYRESWRIRVVIDDLNSFRNTYPEMREDPLMLPSLLSMFRREGVTSLMIDTQASGSPDLSITERLDSSVRQLVLTRIYIWRLPFYGENRVAISVIPPMSQEHRGLIRELRWDTRNESRTDQALTVDPHFELYSGIERGQPQPVPLEVRLYCDTPAVARYVEAEERLLREIFTPVQRYNQEPRVIVPAQIHEYEPLRDASHIQRDTRLDHTTIIQVNEFWWLRRPRQRRAGAFRSQWNYLSAVTATVRGERYQSDLIVDPFWVFQPPPRDQLSPTDSPSTPQPNFSEKAVARRKLDFFDEDCGYKCEKLEPSEEQRDFIDRVPYTWDFGFLLCNRKAWEEACAPDANSALGHQEFVEPVWRFLRKASDKKNPAKSVSWREFLQASKIVAEFQSFRTSKKASAFDLTMLIPESFSCLMLEMWLSESYQTLTRYIERSEDDDKTREFRNRRKMLEDVNQRNWYSDTENPVSLVKGLKHEAGLSLQDIMAERTNYKTIRGFSLELYKVWLLLTEALNFEDLVDSSSHLNFEFKSRDAGPNSVSARHWYKTASNFVDSLTPEQLEYDWVPVRLPGHFSVRADWFLAVAGGSRSSRLADHALDLLSSQRANITRLQEGIGLPTRKLFDKSKGSSHLRTRLVAAPKGRALENIEYDDLRRIGAQQGNGEDFFWLWRSGIWGYNRHSRVWHKWLNRALLWWHSKHQLYNSSWTNGFDAYDRLVKIEFAENKETKANEQQAFDDLKLASWSEFDKLRNILIAELQQVSLSAIAGGASDLTS